MELGFELKPPNTGSSAAQLARGSERLPPGALLKASCLGGKASPTEESGKEQTHRGALAKPQSWCHLRGTSSESGRLLCQCDLGGFPQQEGVGLRAQRWCRLFKGAQREAAVSGFEAEPVHLQYPWFSSTKPNPSPWKGGTETLGAELQEPRGLQQARLSPAFASICCEQGLPASPSAFSPGQ